jgi:Cys-tRNA(Pro)/Cys-tRNA(Cys) deacylase
MVSAEVFQEQEGGRMTPAIDAARKTKITHRVHAYLHDPASESYGLEAAEKLGLPADRVFKTLVVSTDTRELIVGVLPVACMLSLKRLARVAGAKKAAMADPSDVQRATGYVLGGVSPLGQKKRLRTIIDASAKAFPSIYFSAGRRGLQIEMDPHDLMRLTGGMFADIVH